MPVTAAVSGQPITMVPPRANYPAGQYPSSQNVSLTVGQSTLLVSASRQSWTSIGSDVVKVEIDISFDGGTTWQLLIGFTASGGTVLDPNSVQATQSSASIGIPQPDNPNRVIRALMQTFTTLSTLVQVTVN
jgi:hypothetical protein